MAARPVNPRSPGRTVGRQRQSERDGQHQSRNYTRDYTGSRNGPRHARARRQGPAAPRTHQMACCAHLRLRRCSLACNPLLMFIYGRVSMLLPFCVMKTSKNKHESASCSEESACMSLRSSSCPSALRPPHPDAQIAYPPELRIAWCGSRIAWCGSHRESSLRRRATCQCCP